MNAVIVIPARWASTRFPGKPLALIAGVTLIQRVYFQSLGSRRANAVFVATDDQRIASQVQTFGGKVVMPRGDFQSGTDRIAAALPMLGSKYDVVVNVQGDEPLLDPAGVDAIIDTLASTDADMATLACPLREDELAARDIVKVVTDLAGNALYFSRAPLAGAQRHVGLYGYKADALRRFASLPPSPLERAESLEQLRALENGMRIRVLTTAAPHLGVDRPEDVAAVEAELARGRT